MLVPDLEILYPEEGWLVVVVAVVSLQALESGGGGAMTVDDARHRDADRLVGFRVQKMVVEPWQQRNMIILVLQKYCTGGKIFIQDRRGGVFAHLGVPLNPY